MTHNHTGVLKEPRKILADNRPNLTRVDQQNNSFDIEGNLSSL